MWRIKKNTSMKQTFSIILIFLSSNLLAQIELFSEENEDNFRLIHSVEKMPTFKGGDLELTRYIKTLSVYSEKARSEEITGTVYIEFYVEEDGSISSPKILKGLHPELDSISIQIIKGMPKWIPAEQKGKPIRCSYRLPFKYELDFPLIYDENIPSKYWKKMGFRKLKKSFDIESEFECWYNFIIWNYGGYKIDEINIPLMLKTQTCTELPEECIQYRDKDVVVSSSGFIDYDYFPSFPGGEVALANYLNENIIYPQEAIEKRIEGRVYVSFVVDSLGNLNDILILKGVNSLLDEEAVRVIKAMPLWTPATHKGKNVNCNYNLPINFILTNSKEKRIKE